MTTNHAKYFKEYRRLLGFKNADKAREFLAGKDIYPDIDYKYIDSLNLRISEIVQKLNQIPNASFCRANLDEFNRQFILEPYQKIRDSGILVKLKNQGRRPEEVLFSWLRGFVILEYFTPCIAQILGVQVESITKIGDDDFSSEETFKRTPKADLELDINSKKVRIEAQSGFQGVNDIKEHKVREARNNFKNSQISTICIHFDCFNGQVAFIRLDQVAEDDVNWITRQQMEGQTVFTIDQNYFKWRLIDPLPKFDELDIEL